MIMDTVVRGVENMGIVMKMLRLDTAMNMGTPTLTTLVRARDAADTPTSSMRRDR